MSRRRRTGSKLKLGAQITLAHRPLKGLRAISRPQSGPHQSGRSVASLWWRRGYCCGGGLLTQFLDVGGLHCLAAAGLAATGSPAAGRSALPEAGGAVPPFGLVALSEGNLPLLSVCGTGTVHKSRLRWCRAATSSLVVVSGFNCAGSFHAVSLPGAAPLSM